MHRCDSACAISKLLGHILGQIMQVCLCNIWALSYADSFYLPAGLEKYVRVLFNKISSCFGQKNINKAEVYVHNEG